MHHFFLAHKYDQSSIGLISNLGEKTKTENENNNSINQNVGSRRRNDEKEKTKTKTKRQYFTMIIGLISGNV